MTKQFQVTEYKHLRWGLQFVPSDFKTTTKKYPLLVFFHGVGETGQYEGDLTKLNNQGPIPFISQIQDKFIVIALQDQYWSPDINQIAYVIKNDPEIKDRISSVHLTGLSAGGQQVMNFVTTTQDLASMVTSVVPMSSPGFNREGIILAVNAKVKCWAFCGLSDTVGNAQATQEFAKALNGKYEPLPVNHGPWYDLYDPKKGIYDWMLTFTTPIIETPKPKVLFQLYDDNTWKSVN